MGIFGPKAASVTWDLRGEMRDPERLLIFIKSGAAISLLTEYGWAPTQVAHRSTVMKGIRNYEYGAEEIPGAIISFTAMTHSSETSAGFVRLTLVPPRGHKTVVGTAVQAVRAIATLVDSHPELDVASRFQGYAK